MANPAPKGKSERRKERLKAALRENLRRRKAQERGRGAAGPAGEGQAESAPAGEPR